MHRKRMWSSVTAVLSALVPVPGWAIVPQSAGGPGSPVTAFVDVAVIPMDQERVLPHQTVLVRGGRIAALGPVAQVAVPAGAERVEGTGKFLLPGLGDMHFHTTPTDTTLARQGLVIALAHGVTTARSMSGSPLHLALRAQVARGTLPGPRLYTAGPTMHPEDLPTPDAAVRAVVDQQRAGYDFMKVYDGDWSAAVLDSLKAASIRTGFPLSGHVPTEDSVGIQWAMSVPYRSMEHLHGYLQYLGVNPHDSTPIDAARLRRVVAATKQSGVWITPTLLAIAQVANYGIDLRLDLLNRVVVALHDAGVGLLLGTDVWWGERCYRDGRPGSPIRRELRLLVAAGLTPYQALETGTRNVARFFGMQDSVGTVTVGKRADLVLLESNPLDPRDDFAALEWPTGVMAGGRWWSRANLDKQLATLGIECQP